MVDRVVTSDPAVLKLLLQHPRICRASLSETSGTRFWQGDWEREICVGDPTAEVFGLVELTDNNPIVCASRVSVPTAASTLALIAIGPLVEAGILTDSPTIVTNAPADDQEIEASLATCGWNDGAALHVEPVNLQGVVTATVMAAIRTPDDLDDIDALYEERFGRSFFVRRDEDSEWDPDVVRGTPYAVYRLRIAPDSPDSLLTIRVMADQNGKAGATQVVHAMNVMAGFEESLGIGGN
jgi:N-acetyl-gamma-glutamylphosphate reductase